MAELKLAGYLIVAFALFIRVIKGDNNDILYHQVDGDLAIFRQHQYGVFQQCVMTEEFQIRRFGHQCATAV